MVLCMSRAASPEGLMARLCFACGFGWSDTGREVENDL